MRSNNIQDNLISSLICCFFLFLFFNPRSFPNVVKDFFLFFFSLFKFNWRSFQGYFVNQKTHWKMNLFYKLLFHKMKRKKNRILYFTISICRYILRHPVYSQLVKVTTDPDALNVDDQQPSHCLLRRRPLLSFSCRSIQSACAYVSKEKTYSSESLLFYGMPTREPRSSVKSYRSTRNKWWQTHQADQAMYTLLMIILKI